MPNPGDRLQIEHYFGLFTLLVIALLVITKITGIDKLYSDGERTGVVYKFANKGLIWKTWEGAMNMGGMIKNSKGGVIPEVWEFSVKAKDKDLVNAIATAAAQGKAVTIHYWQPWRVAWRDGSSSYIAMNVTTNDREAK